MGEETEHGVPDKDRQIPKLSSWLSKSVLGGVARAARATLKDLRPKKKPGRNARFEELVHDRLLHSPFADYAMRGHLRYRVGVRESFGKPLLVNFDLLVPATATREAGGELSRPLLEDVLERVVQTLWHNPEVAPVAVRGRVVTWEDSGVEGPQASEAEDRAQDPAQDPDFGSTIAADEDEKLHNHSTILDMTDVGFPDEIARSTDLHERFGPPAADPHFHP